MRPSHVALALVSAVAVPALPTVAAAAEPPVPSPAPSPAPSPGAGHCVTTLLTPRQMARGATSELRCYPRFDQAMASVGVRVPRSATPADVAGGGASTLVAIHYDGTNGSGDSLSISGTDCNGGGISLSGGWNNAISSTAHQLCGQIKHFANTDYSGATSLTEGGWGAVRNVGSLSNDVGSIRYYEPVN